MTSTALSGYTDWPGLSQVFKLTRERTVAGKTTTEVIYGITSLRRDQADAQSLLSLLRSRWGIENRLNHVRDVTLGEDASRVRKGSAPQVPAGIRNVAIFILGRLSMSSIARAIDLLIAKPRKAINLVCTKTKNQTALQCEVFPLTIVLLHPYDEDAPSVGRSATSSSRDLDDFSCDAAASDACRTP